MMNAYRKLPGDERRRTNDREYIFELRTEQAFPVGCDGFPASVNALKYLSFLMYLKR